MEWERNNQQIIYGYTEFKMHAANTGILLKEENLHFSSNKAITHLTLI